MPSLPIGFVAKVAAAGYKRVTRMLRNGYRFLPRPSPPDKLLHPAGGAG
jgi:hypothetical protein